MRRRYFCRARMVLFAGAVVASALFACGDDEREGPAASARRHDQDHDHDHDHDDEGEVNAQAEPDEPVEAEGPPVTLASADAANVPAGGADLNRVVRDDARGLYAIVSGFGPTTEGAAAAADAAVAPFRAVAARERVSGDAVAEAAVRANEALVRERGEGADVHGATFASVVVSAGTMEVAHVGDVLVFRVRDGAIERVFLGHTVVEDFIRDRQIEGAEAEELRATAPHREVIVRALGARRETTVERQRERLRAGDVLVVASAALHLALGKDRIAEILAATEGGADAKARALVDAVTSHEGADTPTAIVITAR